MGQLTDAQYKIIADRMIEEHRKYGDRLRPGHWADVAARKVASHMADFREGDRMFTESEVRAILRDLLAASEDGPFMPNYDRMDEMVKFHGLSFDPA